MLCKSLVLCSPLRKNEKSRGIHLYFLLVWWSTLSKWLYLYSIFIQSALHFASYLPIRTYSHRVRLCKVLAWPAKEMIWYEVDDTIMYMLQVSKLKEQLETTVQKLNESREVLKTNENGEEVCLTYLNDQWTTLEDPLETHILTTVGIFATKGLILAQ